MEKILSRLSNLLSVKSMVTLVLTGVFAYMACTESISQEFMVIYSVIVAFYFGTQSQKAQDALDTADQKGDVFNSYYTPPQSDEEVSKG